MTMVSNQQNAIAMYVTSGKVSVADYSTLGVKVTITFGDNLIGGESYAHCKFGLFSNHYTESSYNVKIKYLKSNAMSNALNGVEQEWTVDISSITDDCYVGFGIERWYGECESGDNSIEIKLHEIWLGE